MRTYFFQKSSFFSFLFFSFLFFLIVSLFFLNIQILFAHSKENEEIAFTFLVLAIFLLSAKIGQLVEKINQPPVLGELIVGIILGNLTLLGIHFFEMLKDNVFLKFLAELGVVVLLFRIGLESNIHEMKKVGLSSFLVAVIGVISPFLLGTFLVGEILLKESDFSAKLFLGAALTATSVGITARVFKDLGKIQTKEAQTVLGAAVIDDILGLLILAVVSAIITNGSINFQNVFLITLKAFSFLLLAIIIGQKSAEFLGRLCAKIHSGIGMKFSFALSFCLLFSFFAAKVGLAPIVGAFVAGLVLDPVHFRWFRSPKFVNDLTKICEEAPPQIKERLQKIINTYTDKHIEDLIEDIAYFVVPIFFIWIGFQVKLDVFLNLKILLLTLFISMVAIVGKVIAGIASPKGSNKLLVGFGMVPRGEVGLIFAAMGKTMGVVNDEIYSAIVAMIILTTLITPPILSFLIKKKASQEAEVKS